MSWKKTPSELVEFLDNNLSSFDCQRKMMFGYPVYFVNNNMFTGSHQENIFIRLSNGDREEILSKSWGARPFEPMKGRIMKEYVVVPDLILKDKKGFKEWLNRSYKYVSSLPPKIKKENKERKQA